MRKAFGILILASIVCLLFFVAWTSNGQLSASSIGSYAWSNQPYQYFPLISNGVANAASGFLLGAVGFLLFIVTVIFAMDLIFS